MNYFLIFHMNIRLPKVMYEENSKIKESNRNKTKAENTFF